MRLADVIDSDSFKIDMVRIGEGCPEGCLHCGAYPNCSKASKLRELSAEELGRNLDKGIVDMQGATRGRLVDLFARHVTTDVNTEPLRGDLFPFFADLVYELSLGDSSVVCVSHGVRAFSNSKNSRITAKMLKRLERVVGLMREGKVPLFVLTVDFARSQGKISEEDSIMSYSLTLSKLRPVLKNGWGRVTISIQGVDDDEESPLYRARANEMFQKVLDQVGLSSEERANLNFDTGRAYAAFGRAANIGTHGECDVIPDPEFVDKQVEKPVTRGKVGIDGSVSWQYYELGKTYNRTVDKGAWIPFDDCKGCDVSGVSEFALPDASLDWEKVLESDEEIFKVWPLSLVNDVDKNTVLYDIYQRIGKGDIREALKRNLTIGEVKKMVVKWLLPMEEINAISGIDFFVREDFATERMIYKCSPFKKLFEDLPYFRQRKISEKQKLLNHFAGEAIALGYLLESECDLDYILGKMAQEPGWSTLRR